MSKKTHQEPDLYILRPLYLRNLVQKGTDHVFHTGEKYFGMVLFRRELYVHMFIRVCADELSDSSRFAIPMRRLYECCGVSQAVAEAVLHPVSQQICTLRMRKLFYFGGDILFHI